MNEKVMRFLTGKTEEERKQEKAANRLIKRKATAAAFREREKQSIRLAEEKEKIYADRQIKRMRQPSRGFVNPVSNTGFFSGFSSYYGMGSKTRPAGSRRSKRKVRYVQPRKRGRIRYVYVEQKARPKKRKRAISEPRGFNVIGW